MATAAELVEGSLEAANAARAAALDKMVVPSWMPSFLAFDLDSDKVPDLLEAHLYTEAMDAVLWAILTFAHQNTIAYKVALAISKIREATKK